MQADVRCVGFVRARNAWLYEWEEKIAGAETSAADGEVWAWSESGEAMLDPEGYVPPECVVWFIESDVLNKTREAFE